MPEAKWKDSIWLKVLITLIIALICGMWRDLDGGKVEKEVFQLHQQQEQITFDRIEGTLVRIEEKL
jgi:hypothetical protein